MLLINVCIVAVTSQIPLSAHRSGKRYEAYWGKDGGADFKYALPKDDKHQKQFLLSRIYGPA